ncbi:amidase [Phaeobacter marinintestinus]|uniref:amidase n=1 Tax=Falsiphaeobacter marinintestinus TaxID=1492905 RepID=UPI0011B52C55|nr:amidase [Phaeobacter marinintestinus]
MAAKDHHLLTAEQAAGAIRAGRLSSEDYVNACLECIGDDPLNAWAFLDPDIALVQAREMDRIRKAGRAVGALHGVPVGLKDIVDTRFMPTERGSGIYKGRKPDADATIVNRLREAGAVIMGKTKTTELAFVHPTDTTNPHDPTRTPGGSSSGSAAAVAAHHVPLAIGSQTGGSVIRPASFCGTYGFKPSRGVIARTGVLQTSETLDHLGVFARTLSDVALIGNVIGSYDPRDPASFARPRPDLVAGAGADVPVEPDIAWFDFQFNDLLDADAREGLDAVIDALGPRVERLPVSATLTGLVDVHITIHEYEFCQHLADLIETRHSDLSDTLQAVIVRGQAITQAEYEDAMAVKASADAFFAKHYLDFDAVLSPSATGEAPLLGDGTGDPIFCRIASLCGLPAVTLPLLVGENNLPIGVQLFGAVEEDDRLLRTANWMQTTLAADA